MIEYRVYHSPCIEASEENHKVDLHRMKAFVTTLEP
jgi:hypothetical protein